MITRVLLVLCLVTATIGAPRSISKRCGFLQPISCTSISIAIVQAMVNADITSAQCSTYCHAHMHEYPSGRDSLCDYICTNMQHLINEFHIVKGGTQSLFGK